jgi:hypothetical protein
MKKYLSLLIFLIGSSYTALAQQNNVGINTTTPDPSAALHVEATDKGMLIPRMTTQQRELISNAANGLLVYDLTTNSFWFFQNNGWKELVGGDVKSDGLSDADGDTRVQVEATPNDNTIRFDVQGVEAMTLTPAGELQIRGAGPDDPGFLELFNGDETQFLRFFGGRLGDPAPFLGWRTGSPLRFVTSNFDYSGFTEHLRIDGSGKIGIGTDSPNALLDIQGGALLVQGTTGSTPVSGPGTRLMWAPEKAAFRAGIASGAEWDDVNIGTSSFVGGGYSNEASSNFSFVGGGGQNTASATYSFVGGGYSNEASGDFSFVGGGGSNTASGLVSFVGGGSGNTALSYCSFVGGGWRNTASGDLSFVGGGKNLLARSYSEAVFGTYNTDYPPDDPSSINLADRLFVIGNGTADDARSNAVTVLKNGKVGIGTDSPTATLDIEADVPNLRFKDKNHESTATEAASIISAYGSEADGVDLAKGRLWYLGSNSIFNYDVIFGNQTPQGSLILATAGTPRVHIDPTGRVGIGATTPQEKLEVAGNVKATAFLGDGSQLTGLLPAGPQAGDITYYDGSAWQVLEPAAEGQVLTLNSGIPAWKTPSIKTDNLLQVGLPDGNILYVHPTDNSTGIPWGDYTDIPRVDNITTLAAANMDFKGAANTLAIVNALGNYNSGAYAAKLCADLVAFGFDDWYLPAAGELNIMYQQLGPLTDGGSGDITSGTYWCSSEYDGFVAWAQVFVDGSQYVDGKVNGLRCRCVRR